MRGRGIKSPSYSIRVVGQKKYWTKNNIENNFFLFEIINGDSMHWLKSICEKIIFKFGWTNDKSHKINLSQKNSGGNNKQTVIVSDNVREKIEKE